MARFWVGGTASWDGTAGSKWSTTTGGASGAAVPIASDDVSLDANSGANTVTIATTAGVGRSLDCTGFTGSLVHGSGISLVIGDASGGAFKFVPGMTYTPSGSASAGIQFKSSSTNGGVGWPITTAGKSMGVNGSILRFNSSGKYVFQDAFSCAAGCSVQVTGGEVDTNNQAVTVGLMTATGAATRVLTLGTSTITFLNTPAQSLWTVSGSGVTVNAASATFVFGSNSANTRVFDGFGQTYGTLTYNRSGSTGGMDITGSNTFGTINFSDVTNARTLRFVAATTNTITSAFNVNGTAGKLMTIGSTTAATHTLSKASGQVSCDYLSISNSIATGGAAWYAGANSVDGGGNTGWIFTAPPGTATSTGTMFPVM